MSTRTLQEVYALLVGRRDTLETELAEINNVLSAFPNETRPKKRTSIMEPGPTKSSEISPAKLELIRNWILDTPDEFNTSEGAEAVGVSTSLFLKGMRVLLNEETPIVELASETTPGRRGKVYVYRRKSADEQ